MEPRNEFAPDTAAALPDDAALPESLFAAVEAAIEAVGPNLVVGAPLGIGKPNPLLNAFYHYACHHPHIQLNLFTALSLAVPDPGHGLRARFAGAFLRRHFGADYPHLAYLPGQRSGRQPPNIHITEFYLQPGSMMYKPLAQRYYISSNYTHVARDMDSRGVNVICQMVSARDDGNGRRFSLSSNPDVTLDLDERLRRGNKRCFKIALVNPHLPYMANDAEVDESFFDCVIDEPACYFPPYAVPRAPISRTDYAIGLHASTLIRDGGTLQIGIGSLGDALCHALILRHQQPAQYHSLIAALEYQHDAHLLAQWGGLEPFTQGLYAASEMFLDGFVHLYDAGILKRRVFDDVALQELLNRGELRTDVTPATLAALHRNRLIHSPLRAADVDWLRHWGILAPTVQLDGALLRLPDGRSRPATVDDLTADDTATEKDPAAPWHGFLGRQLAHGRVLHAAFFLGSRWFYQRLRDMDDATRDHFAMCRVSRINQLYESEAIDRAQRLEARFLNTCMKMTLLGAAVSDGLSDGQMVSGVGGQYNFVAMAHALHRGRSILMLRSTRENKGVTESNLVWEYPHATIPRHLRDLVITEYGVADLRGKTDEEVIQQLIMISDARFHDTLIHTARRAGKLSPHWSPPAWCTENTPQELQRRLRPYQSQLPPWPFGNDFTALEQQVLDGLQWLARARGKPVALVRAWLAGGTAASAEEREPAWCKLMGLDKHWRHRLLTRLLRGAMRSAKKNHS